MLYFNSQPHEEADVFSFVFSNESRYFNSQPHEEADDYWIPCYVYLSISTHSLTKRLTETGTDQWCPLHISTHSLTKRLTIRQGHSVTWANYFNSQPHEEADQLRYQIVRSYLHFNSQPHEEADRPQRPFVTADWIFQLTASRRGWRDCGKKGRCSNDISTHSLTKRLTISGSTVLTSFLISTHSLTKRLTSVPSIALCINVFQLTASRRGWLFLPFRFPPFKYFNSQPHEEADELKNKKYIYFKISTHSLTKRLTFRQ